jgi:hypothetical protein
MSTTTTTTTTETVEACRTPSRGWNSGGLGKLFGDHGVPMQ